HAGRRGVGPDSDGIQAPGDAGGAPWASADSAAAAGDGVGGAARHPNPHGRHARAATPHQAGACRRADRDGAGVRLPLSHQRARRAEPVKFYTRLVVGTVVVLLATVLV